MPLEVGIVGLPSAGKTTLFTALTGVAGDSAGYGKPHVGMASIPDERVERVAEVAGSAKATLAAIGQQGDPAAVHSQARALGVLGDHLRGRGAAAERSGDESDRGERGETPVDQREPPECRRAGPDPSYIGTDAQNTRTLRETRKRG